MAGLANKLTRITQSPEETFAMGKALGRVVFDGAVIALTGVLGSGKTLFIQGLARGLDVSERVYVTSPSYTLINEYPGRITLYHADLYRLSHPEDIESTGLYDLLHQEGIVAIEWADRMLRRDLAEHLAVHFSSKEESVRVVRLRGYGQRWNNLLRELEKWKSPGPADPSFKTGAKE